MKILAVRKRRRGFLLMEVVLAMMVFAVMSVGFTRALSAMRKNSRLVSEQMQIAQVVDSALTEALTLSSLEEGETLSSVGENNMEVLTIVEPLELENEEGRVLQQMFSIRIIATWNKNGQQREVSAEGWRNLRLYKP
ncbi:MAG: prepilin-type N-terminal cleavage/methylation domain-containing protein [Akkermansiaceae bacterium]|jgi:type II secretory pathway component PulJ|nr:prepilin-type N-terminal cleavage/methylation domain-containing protein [Akkermansiaceae bacterium]